MRRKGTMAKPRRMAGSLWRRIKQIFACVCTCNVSIDVDVLLLKLRYPFCMVFDPTFISLKTVTSVVAIFLFIWRWLMHVRVETSYVQIAYTDSFLSTAYPFLPSYRSIY
jgi:hypothetical protein